MCFAAESVGKMVLSEESRTYSACVSCVNAMCGIFRCYRRGEMLNARQLLTPSTTPRACHEHTACASSVTFPMAPLHHIHDGPPNTHQLSELDDSECGFKVTGDALARVG